LNITTKS